MDLSITTHNLDMTPRLHNYVEKKTGRLDRYMPNLAEVRVELSNEHTRNAEQRQVAQVTIRDTRGTVLRAEERSSDMFIAIDAVVDKLYHQIKRYRGKWQDRRRSGGVNEMIELEPLPLEEEEEATIEVGGAPVIVRRKRFALQPMTADEAIEQMELLGHDFFVYFDAEAESTSVVYRRHDGNYGLLQPEFD